ncbi:hypothetical protein DYB32_005093 [Aphanomyces invadans]|uniref:BAG domain-containing protein n=1 Tax=Aphanomyces invadans TaxID=157072 RepID=A0A3R7D068_9STRA|nr:hypothetical protein DYB32_005093 [Aphanomyces invadans]
MTQAPTAPNDAQSQLHNVAKTARDIEEILVQRLPNQRKIVAASAAAKKWLAMSIWKHDNDRILAGHRQVKMSLKHYCRRVLSQAEDLTKLLFDLDLILSDGDATVRQERKCIVGKIQELLLVADKMAVQSDRLTRFVHLCLAHKTKCVSAAVPDDDATTDTSSIGDLGDDYELVEWMAEHHKSADSGDLPIDTDATSDEIHCDGGTDAPALGDSSSTAGAREAQTMGQHAVDTVHPISCEQVTPSTDNIAITGSNTAVDEPIHACEAKPGQKDEALLQRDEPGRSRDDDTTSAASPSLANDATSKKPHMVHVHVHGRTYVAPIQGDTTHIYINDPNSYDCIAPYYIPHVRRCAPEIAMRTRPRLFHPALVRQEPVVMPPPFAPFRGYLW